MLKKYSRRDWVLLAVSFILLGASYWLCRYALFEYRGMKQWPSFLALLSLATILAATLAGKVKLALLSAAGYGCGFGIGCLFQSDVINHDGLQSNNMWQLWLFSLLCFIAIGILIEILVNRKSVFK